jgi:hypothetical protein
VTVSGPPGTVAIFDQATWHAVQSRTRDGLRMFVGLWFTAPGRPLGERVDRALEGLVTTDPLLASVLEGRPARGGR